MPQRVFLKHSTKEGCDWEVLSYDREAGTAQLRTPDGREHHDHAFFPAKLKLVGYILTSEIPASFKDT